MASLSQRGIGTNELSSSMVPLSGRFPVSDEHHPLDPDFRRGDAREGFGLRDP